MIKPTWIFHGLVSTLICISSRVQGRLHVCVDAMPSSVQSRPGKHEQQDKSSSHLFHTAPIDLPEQCHDQSLLASTRGAIK